MDQSTGSEAAEAGRFYDALRSSGLSAAALARGAASIGQECLLRVDEIATLARRAGITAGTPVLDVGSGTGAPACYLARELGCRVLGVDVSAVGHAQAEARRPALHGSAACGHSRRRSTMVRSRPTVSDAKLLAHVRYFRSLPAAGASCRSVRKKGSALPQSRQRRVSGV